MSPKLIVLAAVTLAVAILTAVALTDAGYLGIFAGLLQSWAGTQVLADLVILGALACVWTAGDARPSGVPA